MSATFSPNTLRILQVLRRDQPLVGHQIAALVGRPYDQTHAALARLHNAGLVNKITTAPPAGQPTQTNTAWTRAVDVEPPPATRPPHKPAMCRGQDPDQFFTRHMENRDEAIARLTPIAAQYCAPCPLLEWCAKQANRNQHGMWGGVLVHYGRHHDLLNHGPVGPQ